MYILKDWINLVKAFFVLFIGLIFRMTVIRNILTKLSINQLNNSSMKLEIFEIFIWLYYILIIGLIVYYIIKFIKGDNL